MPRKSTPARRHLHLDGAVRVTSLPNGIRVISEDMRSSRTFAVGVFAGVGSRHESAARHGASHFLEHVLFKGTPTRTAEEISAAVESVGGELNAYTAKEHTCFYARVLHTDADLAIDVLADMVDNSTVTSADVEAERAVILDEIAMHGDDPAELVTDLTAGALFGPTGLGRAVIGSPTSIAAMSRTQIVRHWRRHYQPETMVVAAAGRVDHDRLVDQLAARLDRQQTAAPSPPGATRVDRDGGLVRRIIGLEQTTAMLSYPAPGVLDDRRYPIGLLSLILGGGMSSRLFVEVRERRGLTYGIDAGETSYSDAGIWSVDWQCAPGRLVDIVDVVQRILADVAANGVSEAELVRAQGQMAGQTALSYEGASARMSRLGVNALLGDDRTLNQTLARFAAVTPAEIQSAAATLFAQPPLLALVGPSVPTGLLEHWTERTEPS